ncbi:unnamed protein product, partial [Ectocarpus sp. 8 AP-2014]
MLSADGRRELGYTWSDIKMHSARVSGWLPRDPIVGCDTADEMAWTVLR